MEAFRESRRHPEGEDIALHSAAIELAAKYGWDLSSVDFNTNDFFDLSEAEITLTHPATGIDLDIGSDNFHPDNRLRSAHLRLVLILAEDESTDISKALRKLTLARDLFDALHQDIGALRAAGMNASCTNLSQQLALEVQFQPASLQNLDPDTSLKELVAAFEPVLRFVNSAIEKVNKS